jgi:cytochrome c oxidase subunit IV
VNAHTEIPHTTSVSRILWVLIALLTLLAVSALSALVKLGPWNSVINVGVSITKTLLVMVVFMHETEARNLIRVASALGFVWLAMLIGLAVFDYMTRSPVPAPW